VGGADSRGDGDQLIFHETKLQGAFLVELDKHEDNRGFFARAFCAKEFVQHGLDARVVQANISGNHKKGTIRGLHYQVPPADETKFIRCIRGTIWDVIVDLRPDSPTYLQHAAFELSADNYKALYVPAMFAHGKQSLTDDTQMLYLMSQFYTPGCERGVRYDDPALDIEWPLPVTDISDKDHSWPLLRRKKIQSA
jgi:dTDP-4-dehydrorhamnose 3,5-epimerase